MMKNKKMKRNFLILLSVFCMLSLLSCGQAAEPADSSSEAFGASGRKATEKEKEAFSFTLPDPVTEVSCGETVEYTAHLVNNTGSECTLFHAIPLIGIYTYPEGEKPNEALFASLVTTQMQVGEQVDKSVKFTFDEAGEYKVCAFCCFSIGGVTDGVEYSYEVEYSVHVS